MRAHRRTFTLGFFALVLLVALGLLAGCGGRPGLAVYLRTHAAEVELPASMATEPTKVVVAPGSSARSIGRELEQMGLIRDAQLFEAYVRVNGLDSQLQAGTYVLNPAMNLREVVEALQTGRAATVSLTVREGWRLEQTADYLAASGVITDATGGAAYRDQAARGDLTGLDVGRYPFLQERPAGASLEGYLYPATYVLPMDGVAAQEMLARQLDAFAANVVPLYAEAADATDLTLHQVLTLASIVEREAVVPAERPTIAGVFLNRLAQGIKLDADPTVQYALGYQPESGQWWKTPIFLEEYGAVASPYNTYLNPGLPPGPIAAPGLDSVRAVLYPEQHDYLYFVAIPDGSGRHVFAATFAEHEENVRKYQGQ